MEIKEELEQMESSESHTSFNDIYDPDMLKKVYQSYDEYMIEGDFKKNIIDGILSKVSANEHLNLRKILTNLQFSEDQIEWQSHFLLMNCTAYHTVDLLLNDPEKVTFNHKMALYAMDLYVDMQGDENYPHLEFRDQLMECAEMFGDRDSAGGFIETAFGWIKEQYIERYKAFQAIQGAK